MITILTTTEKRQIVEGIIQQIERLGELVRVVDEKQAVDPTTKLLEITKRTKINVPLDWYDTEPPYIFPATAFTPENLLALVFYKLGNHQRAFEFLTEQDTLFMDLLVATYLQFGYEISNDLFDNVALGHNKCVVLHYGNVKQPTSSKELSHLYAHTISQTTDLHQKAFSVKQYVNLLLDLNDYDEAEKQIRSILSDDLPDTVKIALEIQLAHVFKARLEVPYDEGLLNQTRQLFQKGITHFEGLGNTLNMGLLCVEESKVATFQKDFASGKNLIQKAITIFKEADIPEFLGEAGLQKANLLYAWSKNGSPQYYKAAINAFQDVLKVFKRDSHPIKFAEIQHNLALIYSEIQVSEQEKPIWTAFCASAFKEALNVYTKQEFPYEFAMVCHNYATALMGFPEAKLHDNATKANQLFEEALAIRRPELFPTERALTLINQLELLWILHNESVNDEIKKQEEMVQKAEEVILLVPASELAAKAQEHLTAINELKLVVN